MTRLLILMLCLALAGCAGFGSSSTITSRVGTNEVTPPHHPLQRARRADRSALDAVRRFASAYINWSAQSVAADMRALASLSVGQARAAVQLAAATTAQDYELRQGGIANQGTVEAIAPLAGQRGHYVVVTLERTTATNTNAYQGLRPAWHVAVATVIQISPGRWVLSGWQPES